MTTKDESEGQTMSKDIEEVLVIPEEVAACLRYDVPDSAACDAIPADLRISQAELAKVIGEQVDRLPSNEQKVIRAIYYEGKNTIEVAKEFSRSRSRIGQIEANALHRLRRSSLSLPILIAAGLKEELTPKARAEQEAVDKTFREQARQRKREEQDAREAQERQKRESLKKQLQQAREKFLIVIPAKAPPKLVQLQGIIDSLTAEEEQAIKDYLGLCRFKKCGRKSNEYGYCQSHTKTVLGQYFLDDGNSRFSFLDSFISLLLGDSW